MADATYADAVASLLASKGWEASTTRVREDSVLVRGVRDADGTAKRLVGLAVTGNPVAAAHLQYLLETASDANADVAMVATPASLTPDARSLVEQYGVEVVDAETVAEQTDWQPATAGDAEPADSATADAEARDDRPASSETHAGREASAAGESSVGTDAGGDAERGARDDAGVADAPADGEPTPPESSGGGDESAADVALSDADDAPADGGFGRRDALKLGGVGVAAAVGWFAYETVLNDGPDGPEATVRAFYSALDDGDVARARELVHEDGESLDASNVRQRSVEIVSLEQTEREADAVAFEITLRVDDSYRERAVVTVRRNDDGEWRMVGV